MLSTHHSPHSQLPVSFRIDFNILLLVTKLQCTHVSEMLFRYVPGIALRSSDTGLLTVPKSRTKRLGEAAFSYYGPIICSSLPEDLRGSESVDTFLFFINMYVFFPHFRVTPYILQLPMLAKDTLLTSPSLGRIKPHRLRVAWRRDSVYAAILLSPAESSPTYCTLTEYFIRNTCTC